MRFEAFGLNEGILEAISYMGFEEATPIQEQAIPKILSGKDVIACAQTGTGKTAAFILPTLHQLKENMHSGCRVLVIVPTRELALQIDQQIEGFSYFTDVHSIAIYGGGDGQDFEQQKKALKGGADIVVATPGKLISHLNMGYVRFDQVDHLILDEADRMLDMGFVDDIRKIISFLPSRRQTLLFSATMPNKIKELARDIMQHPDEIYLSLSKPAEGVLQAAYLIYDNQKIPLLKELISDKPNYRSIIIFVSTKNKVAEVERQLKKTGLNVEAISSDLDQDDREAVMRSFKAKKIRILVATDVISRGIDIADINLVINFDVPNNAEDYVHRVGRTARADTTGVALTLVNPGDAQSFDKVEKLIGMTLTRAPLPSTLGVGPTWEEMMRPGKKTHRPKHKKPTQSKNAKRAFSSKPRNSKKSNKRENKSSDESTRHQSDKK